MKLVLDIGNTRTKIALFDHHKITETRSVKGDFSQELRRMLSAVEDLSDCIVSSVSMSDEEVVKKLAFVDNLRILFIRSGILLPIKMLYKTPETLGNDRLANAAGAWKLNKDRNSLVVDLGTCLKFDVVSLEGAYLGGSISPGLMMRYKALTHFTEQLPYFKPQDEFPALTGQSTEGAIRSGVENGMTEEINGIINRYQHDYGQIDVILTGGDHHKFADKLKSPIFVAPNLTLIGLKEILDCNEL